MICKFCTCLRLWRVIFPQVLQGNHLEAALQEVANCGMRSVDAKKNRMILVVLFLDHDSVDGWGVATKFIGLAAVNVQHLLLEVRFFPGTRLSC